MPVAKQGESYIYIKPVPHPCAYCGVLVVDEYGRLDAQAYNSGVVLRHLCEPVIEPLQERQWRALVEAATRRPVRHHALL